MKLSKLAIATAVAGLLAGHSAQAEQPSARATSPRAAFADPGIVDPVVRSSSFVNEYDAPAEPPSPSDAPAASGSGCTSCGSCGSCNGCNSCYSCSGCGLGDPWKFFDNDFLTCRGINISGFSAQSFTWNPYSPRDRFNGPVTWMDRSNEAMLNQFYLYAEKVADNGGEGTALGWRADALYGTDHRFTTAGGLEDRINKSHAFYGLALPQFYGEVAYNDLKVKLGHFYSPVGYFVVPTALNFFNTLPYTFQYGEPFTHTGILGAYQMTDDLNVGAGIHRGWDSFDFNPHLGGILTATRTNWLKEGDSLAFVSIFGKEPNLLNGGVGFRRGGPAFSSRYLQTVTYTRPINDCLTTVFQTDFGVQGQAFTDAGGNNRTARWYGMNSYTFLKVNDHVTWGFNNEWFRDDGGFRVGGFLPNFPNNTNGGPTLVRGLSPARSGFDGTFSQMTFGPQIRPNANLLIRPNVRGDWYVGPRNAAGLLPFGDGNRWQQVIFSTDAVVFF